MATPNEKEAFINSMYKLHQACNAKANDGGLASDQRSVFITAILYLGSDLGKAWNRDFSPIPSELVEIAVKEIIQAISATHAAVDDSSVQVAAKELWDANTAIDNVLV
ncbi:hypothetical protein LOY44_12860 [Pseudomonas sp. B21-044]|uniref:hypothetical protein n=1 Tax=Pseudomonas sp. B21-044 TaxID=2895488 RepID=UPI00215E3F9E|nr:hypothetical protein [Pseudomonas sp. B21-044]UVL21740.1 hypothetical protein LOY44_12860 [Pseudomonas sp. B21-044]